MGHVRSVEALWSLRRRRHVVVACVDNLARLETVRRALGALRAEPVVEPAAGLLPAALVPASVRSAGSAGTGASAVPDVLAPGLRVVFCGINPGRVSAAARAHFANPRNDFWRLLHDAGFTPRRLEPHEQFAALEYGIGLTNAAGRTTPGSGDLRAADFAGSVERLERLARELRPLVVAFVGKEAYRGVFRDRPELGLQERRLVDAVLFVLPSTSPANAAVPYTDRLRWFRALERVASRASGW